MITNSGCDYSTYLPTYLTTLSTYVPTYPPNLLPTTASQRGREAAAERAEAEKILQVKAAEAEGESKYLRGVGVAKERQAIVEGLRYITTELYRTGHDST